MKLDADFKTNLVKEMKLVGAYEVRAADPRRGFEHSIEDRHPLSVMPECQSVIVFIVARAADSNDLYPAVRRGKQEDKGDPPAGMSPEVHSRFYSHRMVHLFTSLVSLRAISFLAVHGFRGIDSHTVVAPRKSMLQDKLCAYEAGIGVYGRNGLILHPELGNRIAPGVILTDALLEPDTRLDAFDPCGQCQACIDACPVHALDPDGVYPASFDRQKCVTFKERIRRRGYLCRACWEACPVGQDDQDDLFLLHRAKSHPPRITKKAI